MSHHKFSLKYFRKRWKICKFCEIKEPRNVSAIQYVQNFITIYQVHGPVHAPFERIYMYSPPPPLQDENLYETLLIIIVFSSM